MRQRIKLRFLLLIVTGEQRPHGAGDAAILLGIVRFERVVQLIEEDRQVAVTFAQTVDRPAELIDQGATFPGTTSIGSIAPLIVIAMPSATPSRSYARAGRVSGGTGFV